MELHRRCLVAAFIFWFALPILAAAQKDESQLPTAAELELKACGPKEKEPNYYTETDKSQHPTGTPAADTVLIYIIRSTRLGMLVQTKLAVDGEWKGVNKAANYFFFTLPPGEHYFCSSGKAGGRRTLVITLEAGKTYYISQNPRNDLGVLDDAEGQKELAGARLNTWKVK